MSASKRPVVFILALATTLWVVSAVRGHPSDGRAAAEAALAAVVGSDCQSAARYSTSTEWVDAMIAQAAPDAGWVYPDRLFVGDLPAAAQELGASVVAEEANVGWLLADGGNPRLLELMKRTAGGKTGFMVQEIIRGC